jgi:hypothetical protein
MTQAAENERLKLTANWVNGISVAVVGGGVIVPFLSRMVNQNDMDGSTMVLLFLSCCIAALPLHFVGLKVLAAIQ